MASWFLHNPVFLILLPIVVIPWINFPKRAKVLIFPGCSLLQNAPLPKTKTKRVSEISLSLCLFFLFLAWLNLQKLSKTVLLK